MVPGASFHIELQLLQAAGIPAADVLRIGTSNAARALGVADRLGTGSGRSRKASSQTSWC
jgi:imidazolonepropionase-like amidohydrolase